MISTDFVFKIQDYVIDKDFEHISIDDSKLAKYQNIPNSSEKQKEKRKNGKKREKT